MVTRGGGSAFLTSQFGRDITDRLRLALMAYWRGMRPTVRCERRLGEENTYLAAVWSIGLIGIYAEAEDPLWATKLKRNEAELAARYAMLKLSGLPSWLGSLAKAYPTEVEAIVGAELFDELLDVGGDSSWHSAVLQSLRDGTQEVAQLLLPRLVGWLAWSGLTLMQLPHSPSNERKLSQVVGVPLAHVLGPEVKGPLEELTVAQVQAAGTSTVELAVLAAGLVLACTVARCGKHTSSSGSTPRGAQWGSSTHHRFTVQ